MNIIFLFPSDYFNKKKPDEMFTAQADMVKSNGGDFICIDVDEIYSTDTLETDLHGKTVIYRGWMLSADDYIKMESFVNNAGGKMRTATQQYLDAHYLPNWYDKIKEFTASTIIFDDLEKLEIDYLTIPWRKFFIKDYVKSLKTSIGSIIDDKEKLPIILAEMEKYRGKIEGGICIREFEDYILDSEVRYFVLNGRPFSPKDGGPIPEIVFECSNRINLPFFSVDIIQTVDGKDRVVEIGDGQVSDYVGWDLYRFVSMLLFAFKDCT